MKFLFKFPSPCTVIGTGHLYGIAGLSTTNIPRVPFLLTHGMEEDFTRLEEM